MSLRPNPRPSIHTLSVNFAAAYLLCEAFEATQKGDYAQTGTEIRSEATQCMMSEEDSFAMAYDAVTSYGWKGSDELVNTFRSAIRQRRKTLDKAMIDWVMENAVRLPVFEGARIEYSVADHKSLTGQVIMLDKLRAQLLVNNTENDEIYRINVEDIERIKDRGPAPVRTSPAPTGGATA